MTRLALAKTLDAAYDSGKVVAKNKATGVRSFLDDFDGDTPMPLETKGLRRSRTAVVAMLEEEYERLRTYLSGHVLDEYALDLWLLTEQKVDLDDAEDRDELLVGGVVTKKVAKRTRNGDKYLEAAIFTMAGEYPFRCWPAEFNRLGEMFKPNVPLAFTMRVDKKGGFDAKLIVNHAVPLADCRRNATGVVVALTGLEGVGKLMQKIEIARWEGGRRVPLHVHLLGNDGWRCHLTDPAKIWCDPAKLPVDELRRMVAPHGTVALLADNKTAEHPDWCGWYSKPTVVVQDFSNEQLERIAAGEEIT